MHNDARKQCHGVSATHWTAVRNHFNLTPAVPWTAAGSELA